jgi:surface antigen
LVSTVAVANPTTVDSPTYESAYYSNNPIMFLVDFFRSRASYLDDEDRRLLIQTIMIALEQTENGTTVDWWSKRNPANGHVRVVYTYPTGDGYCRVFQSEVHYKGNIQNYTERACLQQGAKGWRFTR